jgi:hypothetical protein
VTISCCIFNPENSAPAIDVQQGNKGEQSLGTFELAFDDDDDDDEFDILPELPRLNENDKVDKIDSESVSDRQAQSDADQKVVAEDLEVRLGLG